MISVVKGSLCGLGENKTYRIRALKDFETLLGTVHAGDLGGYIASEDNLSQEGACWVFDDAIVIGILEK